jgi:hypothetical protein
MGQLTVPEVVGSRRAAIATLTVSSLLVVGGFVTLHRAGDLRLGPPHPSTTRSVPATPTTTATPSGRP